MSSLKFKGKDIIDMNKEELINTILSLNILYKKRGEENDVLKREIETLKKDKTDNYNPFDAKDFKKAGKDFLSNFSKKYF